MPQPIHWKLYLSRTGAVDSSHQEITDSDPAIDTVRRIRFDSRRYFPSAALGKVPDVAWSFVQADQAVAAALIFSSSVFSSSVAASRAPVCRSTSLAQSVFALSAQETYTSTPRLPS
jgi:hypothetical protein